MNNTFMKEQPVLPLLLSMALPMVLSMLVNSLYNIVDSFFVAQISEDAMTALSLIFPIQNLVNAVGIGFGVGISALIALHLGAGQQERADTAATHGLVLSLLHGVGFTVACIAVLPAFLRMFTSDETVIAMGVQYGVIVFLFSTIFMAELAFEKIFQAVGRMKVTMVGLLCGSVANILLDPLLIFGLGPFPKLGIAGAALATGCGQLLALSFYLAVYHFRPIPVRLSRSCLHPAGELDRRLYAVGIPAALNLALPSLLVSCLNALLTLYSQSYVVILGIYYKLQTFLYLPANGIVQGMRPIIGYNYGAHEYGRVKKIFELTLLLCGAIMAAGTVICLAAAGPLIGLFSDVPETVAAGQTALRIISSGFLFSAVSVTASGALEGLGKGKESLVISACRYILLILPIAWLLSRFFGPLGVWNAFWITEILAAGISLTVYRSAVRKRPQP